MFFISLGFFSNTQAISISSTNFQIENPVIIWSGGESSSTSFQHITSFGETVFGEVSSTSFLGRLGFLYFPVASSAVITATEGDGEVELSWTASTATFANVTHYEVGVSTSSGGSYTFTNVGDTTSYTASSLTNDTTYYFVVRTYADGILLATSSEASATPTSSGGGGGGGGGGGSSGSSTGGQVIFSGRAYPLSRVNFLKDGNLILTTIAGPDSNFSASLSNLSTGTYNFSVYGEDKDGVRGTPFTFSSYISSNVTTNISGIYLAPTIAVDKSEVRKGDNIAVFGQSVPDSQVTININSEPEFFIERPADSNGVYLLNFDTALLELGNHSARSKSALINEISPFSASVGFLVGSENTLAEYLSCPQKGDLNSDCRVNLIDFSIAAFWYRRPLSADFSLKEASQLNGDNQINLVDFSIMAFHWTG